MPHGESWYSVLLGTFYKNVEGAASFLSWPVNDRGQTWIGHTQIGVQHVFGAVGVLIALIVVAALSYRRSRVVEDALVPDGKLTARTFVELVVEMVYGMLRENMEEKHARFFLPLIGTCAFFILFSNASGLIPGMLPPTSALSTTLACGLIIFVSTHVFGVREHGWKYLQQFTGSVIPLIPLFIVIELVSHCVRPVSLAVRLMINMTADHLIVAAFMAMIPFILPVPALLLGVIVVVVQVLVFCMLSTVYISMALSHEEH